MRQIWACSYKIAGVNCDDHNSDATMRSQVIYYHYFGHYRVPTDAHSIHGGNFLHFVRTQHNFRWCVRRLQTQ